MDEIRVAQARGGRPLRAFFSLSEKAGLRAPERKLLRRVCGTPGEGRAFLLALKNGVPAARLLTWPGFFAMADGDEDALDCLFDRAEALQRQWGSDRLCGPALPGGLQLFTGFPAEKSEDAAGLFHLACAGTGRLLRSRGYEPFTRLRAYQAEIKASDTLKNQARRTERRYGLMCRKLKNGLFTRETETCVWKLEKDCREQAARLTERLMPFFAKPYCVGVFDGGGNCRGYALVLKGNPLRVVTIVSECAPATLLLAEGLLERFARKGIRSAELSVIDENNIPSRLVAESFCGRGFREYLQYNKKLT